MSGNRELLEEREFIYDLVGAADMLRWTDSGLGMGQADLCYERVLGGGAPPFRMSPVRRVCLTIRIEDDDE